MTHEEKILLVLKRLRPIDDILMRQMFKDNIPLIEYVLRIIMSKPDLTVIECHTQADMHRLAGARSVCFDVYCTDTSGCKYDVEVQRASQGAAPRRARYHSSVMDIENLDAGEDFDKLPETYTIFITEKDVFGCGQPVYQIGSYNFTNGTVFADGRHILYVNGAYRGENELGDLMHDFCCSAPEDMRCKPLQQISHKLKESEDHHNMCEIIQEVFRDEFELGNEACKAAGKAEGRAEGKAEGKVEGEQNILRELLSIGAITPEIAARFMRSVPNAAQ